MAVHRHAALWGSLLSLALAACAHSPPTRFMTLEPSMPTASGIVAYVGAPVQLEVVRLPADLDRMEITSRAGPNVVQVDDFAHWIAPPEALSRRALALDLAARLPPGRFVFPDEPDTPAIRRLSVEVQTFESDKDGAELDVSWTVVDAGLGPPTVLRRHKRLKLGSAAQGSDGVTAALALLLGRLADAIAADLASGERAPGS